MTLLWVRVPRGPLLLGSLLDPLRLHPSLTTCHIANLTSDEFVGVSTLMPAVATMEERALNWDMALIHAAQTVEICPSRTVSKMRGIVPFSCVV